MALPKKPKRSPAAGELPFERDFDHPAEEVLTAYAGVPLLVRAALPAGVQEFYFRGDAARWDRAPVNWLRDERREGGPQGLVTLGISVRMTANRNKSTVRLPENLWSL